MGLYKRKDNNIWQMCFFVNRKKIRMSTRTSNKKLAQRIYEKARVEFTESTLSILAKSKMTFDRLVDEFIEKHSKVEKASFKSDIYIGERFKKYFKQTPIGKITPYDIKCWRQFRSKHITQKGELISKSTLNRELTLLKTMFNLAVEWGWLKENPAAGIKLLRGEVKRLRYLHREEISRLIECAIPPLKPIIIIALSTGMRRSEIFNLKWKDVDFERGFIRVEKSKNFESRDIPMDHYLSETLLKLRQNIKPGNYVFCRENGDRYKSIADSFRRACKLAGIEDFRFHDLRHTAASMLAGGGCDVITLKNVLGHKSLEMTQRYAHFMPEQHEKTRRIMNNIWVQQDNTNDKPVLIESSGNTAPNSRN